jgi:hypothetical protein
MAAFLDLILPYLVRVLPGFLLGTALLFLFRKRPRIRIGIYLLLFILLRDAMTPVGLWSLGGEGFFWIRLVENPVFLVFFGLSSALLTLAVALLDRPNRGLLVWQKGHWAAGLLVGLGGALVVVLPFFIIYRSVPISVRGGPVPAALLLPLLVFALLGNWMEETLFRGFVLGRLKAFAPPLWAGALSGLIFALCHVFLSATVTDVGWPLLVFTLWEGIIAGVVGARFGVVPATITHGLAVFLLVSGLF